jgi:exonuclease III
MRIVSWNIRAGGGVRVEAIAAQIAAWNADVVALSEYRGTPASLWLAEALQQQGFIHQHSTANPRTPAVNSLLMASRWPMRRMQPRPSPTEPRRWAMFQIAAPTPLAIGAMHVPNRITGRKGKFLNDLLSMAQAWRRGPALIVGDTNTGRIGIDEESPAFDRFEDDWMVAMQQARWRDAFRHIHDKDLAYTWYSPNKGNGFRLDEGFVNVRLIKRMTDACYVWGELDGSSRRDALSDHAALILDFND